MQKIGYCGLKKRKYLKERSREQVRSEINWDKVAEVYGIKELIKNISF